MQSFILAMLQVRETLFAALVRSLLRTKSLLQTILDIWVSPAAIRGDDADKNGSSYGGGKMGAHTFMKVVERAFGESIGKARLLELSDGLKAQLLESTLDNPQCMLPSYNHQLPSGQERGTFLALDVGGSTFRVALVKLSGRENVGEESTILRRSTFKIGSPVKQLKGVLFFDWMAERIEETLSGEIEEHRPSNEPLSMGLAWSFPIEQTSLRSGLLQGMGKGFLAAHGILGQDLGDLIQDACSRRGLNVHLDAIVNDSSATLLSKAYVDPTTRFALILGTGMNAAIHLPVHLFSPSKFGTRPAEWFDSAKHVIVNTEFSMYGGGILPATKWDEMLRANHPKPDFQPFEYRVSGAYLGEIVRLVLVDGIRMAGLLGGVVPPSLKEQYSLDTETISRIEGDRSFNLAAARELFISRHPSPHLPSMTDIAAIRLIASYVTQRAACFLAAGVHALWGLRNDAESILAQDSSHTLVAYNGSVLENYPHFRETCQKQLDSLVKASGGKEGCVELMFAEESSLLGAAIAGAVAC